MPLHVSSIICSSSGGQNCIKLVNYQDSHCILFIAHQITEYSVIWCAINDTTQDPVCITLTGIAKIPNRPLLMFVEIMRNKLKGNSKEYMRNRTIHNNLML